MRVENSRLPGSGSAVFAELDCDAAEAFSQLGVAALGDPDDGDLEIGDHRGLGGARRAIVHVLANVGLELAREQLLVEQGLDVGG